MCAQNHDALGEAVFLEAVDSEMKRRFRSRGSEVWLTEVLDAVNAEVLGDESSEDIPFDSAWELWDSISQDIVTFGYREYTGDSLAMLDFGRGVTYVAVDTNEDRGIDDYLIVAEVVPDDWAKVRSIARSVMRSGAWSGESPGMWPDQIIISEPLTPEDVHGTFSDLFVSHEHVAVGYAKWMEENGYGVWPVANQINRAVLADMYVDAVLSYSMADGEPDTFPEMAPGMLLDDLLGPEDVDSRVSVGPAQQQGFVDVSAGAEDSAGGEVIMVTRVDVDFSDPNIRGASGSVFHAGTDQDREDFLRWIEAGMTDHDATQKLAMRISRRSQRAVEWFPERSGSPST
jgi:hypothetical protein